MKGEHKKILIGGCILLLVAACFFIYLAIQKNKSQGTSNVETEENSQSEEDFDEGESAIQAEVMPGTAPQETKSFVVDAEICEAECSVYQNNQEALTYCQAVCGLSGTEGVARPAPKDCSTLEAVAKDICLRDKAVADNNGELCESITDKGLRDSCRNRIAEERFD
jgi:hypothetical protein